MRLSVCAGSQDPAYVRLASLARIEHIDVRDEEADVLLRHEISARQERDVSRARCDVGGDDVETERLIGTGIVGGKTLGSAFFQIAPEHVGRLIVVPPYKVARARREDDEPAVVADERAEAVVVALFAVAAAAHEEQPAALSIEHERIGEKPVPVVAY